MKNCALKMFSRQASGAQEILTYLASNHIGERFAVLLFQLALCRQVSSWKAAQPSRRLFERAGRVALTKGSVCLPQRDNTETQCRRRSYRTVSRPRQRRRRCTEQAGHVRFLLLSLAFRHLIKCGAPPYIDRAQSLLQWPDALAPRRQPCIARIDA